MTKVEKHCTHVSPQQGPDSTPTDTGINVLRPQCNPLRWFVTVDTPKI